MTNENGRSSTPPPGEDEPVTKYARLDLANGRNLHASYLFILIGSVL